MKDDREPKPNPLVKPLELDAWGAVSSLWFEVCARLVEVEDGEKSVDEVRNELIRHVEMIQRRISTSESADEKHQ